jgi:hypothetical protein
MLQAGKITAPPLAKAKQLITKPIGRKLILPG